MTLPLGVCCPIDHGALRASDDTLTCASCAMSYPTIDGRPVLIDEQRSLFTIAEIAEHADVRQFPETSGWKASLRRLLPASGTRRGPGLMTLAAPHLPPEPRILVVGCGFTRQKFESTFPGATLVLSDVTLRGDADVACDGQCLPFEDESMDMIVLDQVLEHVADERAVLAEARRVLRKEGIVYSGVPFYFPNHSFPFDFRRFTPMGHRMLYPDFELLEFRTTGGPLGAVSLGAIGAGAALSENLTVRRAVSLAVRLALRPVSGLDPSREFDQTPVALGSVFIGRKHDKQLSFQEMYEELSAISGGGGTRRPG